MEINHKNTTISSFLGILIRNLIKINRFANRMIRIRSYHSKWVVNQSHLNTLVNGNKVSEVQNISQFRFKWSKCSINAFILKIYSHLMAHPGNPSADNCCSFTSAEVLYVFCYITFIILYAIFNCYGFYLNYRYSRSPLYKGQEFDIYSSIV